MVSFDCVESFADFIKIYENTLNINDIKTITRKSLCKYFISKGQTFESKCLVISPSNFNITKIPNEHFLEFTDDKQLLIKLIKQGIRVNAYVVAKYCDDYEIMEVISKSTNCAKKFESIMRCKSYKIIKMMQKNGWYINYEILFEEACFKGNLEIMKECKKYYKKNNLSDIFEIICANNIYDSVKFFIDNLLIDIVNSEKCYLYDSCNLGYKDDYKVARLLLKHGCSIGEHDIIYEVLRNGNFDMVITLIKAGCKISNDSIELACFFNDTEIIEAFIQKGYKSKVYKYCEFYNRLFKLDYLN